MFVVVGEVERSKTEQQCVKLPVATAWKEESARMFEWQVLSAIAKVRCDEASKRLTNRVLASRS